MTDIKLGILLDWCQTVGIRTDSRLQLRIVDDPSVGSKEEQDYGIGVFNASKESIDNHTTLVYIPKAAVLSVKSCSFSDLIPHTHNGTPEAHLALALALHGELVMAEVSAWYGYLQSLPDTRVDIALLWEYDFDNGDADSREALAWIRGTEVSNDLRGKNTTHGRVIFDDIRRYYTTTVEPLMTTFLMLPTTFKEYLRAYSLVSSRAFLVDAYHGLAMVPIADAFNHVQENNVHLETDYDVCATCGSLTECTHDLEEPETELAVIRESRSDIIQNSDISDTHLRSFALTVDVSGFVIDSKEDDKDDMYEMVSNTPIMPHEQVFNTYGENLANAQLLIHYGFLLDGNENDVIQWNGEELLSSLSLSLSSEFSLSSSSAASPFEMERRTGLARNRKRVRGMSLIGSGTYTHSLYHSKIDVDNNEEYEEEDERVQSYRRLNSSFECEIHHVPDSRENHPQLNNEEKEEDSIRGQAIASSASSQERSWRSPLQSRLELSLLHSSKQGQEVVEADPRLLRFMTLFTTILERWRPGQTFCVETTDNDSGVGKDKTGRIAGKRKVVCDWDSSGLVYDLEERVVPDTDGYSWPDKLDVFAHDRRRHLPASPWPGLSSKSSASRPLNTQSDLLPSSSKYSHPDTRSHPLSYMQKLRLNDEAKISQSLWLYCVLLQLWKRGVFSNDSINWDILRGEEILHINDTTFDELFPLLDSVIVLQRKLVESAAAWTATTTTISDDRTDSNAIAHGHRQRQRESVEGHAGVTSVSSREKYEKNNDTCNSGDDDQGLWGQKFRPKFPLDRTRKEDLLMAERSAAEVNVVAGADIGVYELSASGSDNDEDIERNELFDIDQELSGAFSNFAEALRTLEECTTHSGESLEDMTEDYKGDKHNGVRCISDRGRHEIRRRRRTSRGIIGNEQINSSHIHSQPRKQNTLTTAAVAHRSSHIHPGPSHLPPIPRQFAISNEDHPGSDIDFEYQSSSHQKATRTTIRHGHRQGEEEKFTSVAEANYCTLSAAKDKSKNKDDADVDYNVPDDGALLTDFCLERVGTAGTGGAVRDCFASPVCSSSSSSPAAAVVLRQPDFSGFSTTSHSTFRTETRRIPAPEQFQNNVEVAYDFFEGVSDIVCSLCAQKILGQGMYPTYTAEQLGDIVDNIPRTRPRTRKAAMYALSERSLLESCISAWKEFAEALRDMLMPER